MRGFSSAAPGAAEQGQNCRSGTLLGFHAVDEISMLRRSIRTLDSGAVVFIQQQQAGAGWRFRCTFAVDITVRAWLSSGLERSRIEPRAAGQ